MKNYIMPALAFVLLAWASASANYELLQRGDGDNDWLRHGLLWLPPGLIVLAVALGSFYRRWAATAADNSDELTGPETWRHFGEYVLARKLSPPTAGIPGDTPSPTSHPLEEVRMFPNQFQPGEAVSVRGTIYSGPAEVEAVKDGKVFVRTPPGDGGRKLSYHQGDLDQGKLQKAGAAPPASPGPFVPPIAEVPDSAKPRATLADFRVGQAVTVEGGSYRGTGVVVAPRHHDKVTVRVGDGRLFSYSRADLDQGKLTVSRPTGLVAGIPAAVQPQAQKAQPEAPAPQAVAEAPRSGAVVLPSGGDVTITVGDISITVAHRPAKRA